MGTEIKLFLQKPLNLNQSAFIKVLALQEEMASENFHAVSLCHILVAIASKVVFRFSRKKYMFPPNDPYKWILLLVGQAVQRTTSAMGRQSCLSFQFPQVRRLAWHREYISTNMNRFCREPWICFVSLFTYIYVVLPSINSVLISSDSWEGNSISVPLHFPRN